MKKYGISLAGWRELGGLDAMIHAVDHDFYRTRPRDLLGLVRPGGVLVDVKSALDPRSLPDSLHYWSL